jgi:SAM-dependent methyltransferase
MDHTDQTYGNYVAPVYDGWHSSVDPHLLDRLTELAGHGPALELGIGTGRIALPLVARGIEITGIDASQPMLEQLQVKPGAEKIQLHVGSFADFELQTKFNLAYVVFNTFYWLTTQTEQVRCFKSVARHLNEGGCFAIEGFVANLTRFQSGQFNWATSVTEELVQLEVGQHDSVNQLITMQKVLLTNGNVNLYPIKIRYVWPSELDLMAQLAGLRLRARWSSWQQTPFENESGKQISIYERSSEL